MKVHLIKKQTIEDFAGAHARSRTSFEEWIEKLKHADWEKTNDIKETFGSADLLGKGSDRVAFNIGGNAFRFICKYVLGEKQVHLFVCWIGTHTEYDELNNKNEQYSINLF